MRSLGELTLPSQYEPKPKLGYLTPSKEGSGYSPMARSGSSSSYKESGRSWWEARISAEMSVIWLDRQVGGTGAGQSSLHVGVTPVPQGLVSFLDDLGRCPAQDVVRASWFVIGSCGREDARWSLAGWGMGTSRVNGAAQG